MARKWTPLVAGLSNYDNRAQTYPTGTARFRVFSLRAASVVRLVYGNWYGQAEADTGNDLPIQSAIEVGGVITPVTFGGVRDVTVPRNGVVVSDPITVSIAAGATLYVRTYWNAGAGYYPTMATLAYGAGQTGGDSLTSGSNVVDTAGALGVIAASVASYGPLAILSEPAVTDCKAGVILSGDSITGVGATYKRNAADNALDGTTWGNDGGWFSRAMRVRGIGHLALSCGGERSTGFILPGKRFAVAARLGTHLLIGHGYNDFYGDGVNLATLKARILRIADQASAYGLVVLGQTLTPKTTSTDLWLTTENQTVVDDSVRVPYNDWMRTTPAPFAGYFDLADLMETSRNSGKFKIGPVYVTGVVASATASTLTATANIWPDIYYAVNWGTSVRITGGTGAGQVRSCGSSTARTNMAVSPDWSVAPDATSTFEVYWRYTADGTHPTPYANYAIASGLTGTEAFTGYLSQDLIASAQHSIDQATFGPVRSHSKGKAWRGTL